ncbi:MAG: sulfatase-like hydrolase/transferase [Actinomycetota bacterium]
MSEEAGKPATDRTSPRPFDIVISVVVLFVLAVAQPLLDLLGRNAEFFLARAAPSLDIVILAVLLTFVIPLLIGLAALGITRIHEPTGRIVHGVIVTILGAVLALQVIELTPITNWPAWVEITIAVAVGVIIAYGFYGSESVRAIGRYSAIAPFAVLGLFLFTSTTSQLVFASTSAVSRPAEVSVGRPAPVIFIGFDEFPVASLMDAEGDLQEEVYPNFARLARDSIWYPNAVTVQQQTEQSYPTILSGVNAPEGKIPTASDYPFTLFTLLADSYDLKVQEAVTDLCPEYACENTSRTTQPAMRRWRTLVSDLRIVAGHLFLPDDLTASLPSIDSSWSNFSGENSDFNIIERFQEVVYDGDRLDRLARFVDGIEPPDGEPTLNFIHALIPHVPWSYLPSGQTYPKPGRAPGTVSPGWGEDTWLVDQAYQQHLVQVQFVDTFVGRVIDELEADGVYDDALIVVLADHGVTVRPDTYHRRHATEETIGDVAAIPLFIKYPNQLGAGAVDDYRVETIDILPTIADVLDVEVPWTVEGTSLFSGDRPVRTESQINGDKGVITFGVDGSEARGVAARKIDHFGTDGPFGLAPPGQSDLLGLSIATIDIESSSGTTATIRNLDAYENVNLDGPELPAWIRGVISPGASDTGDLIVAVSVNGQIATVTRTFVNEDGAVEYGALIPPSALQQGGNGIELILVHGEGSGRTFSHLGQ